MSTPAQRSKNITTATEKARRQYDKFEQAQLESIYDLFDDTAKDLTVQISRYETAGIVPPERLQLTLNTVTNELIDLRVSLDRMILTGINDTVNLSLEQQIYILNGNVPAGSEIQIGTSYFRKDGTIARYNSALETYAESQWHQVNSSAVRAVLSWNPAGETLSDTIWNVAINAEKSIHNQIRISLLQGESATTLSRRIRPFLIEPDKQFRRVKKGYKFMPSKAMRDYTPGRGVYKSAYKNALRTARTEYARAYTEGTIHYSHGKDFIQGWISRIGSGDPAPYDISVNGKFFSKERGIDIPYHPNCMCYAETATIETPESKLKPAMDRTAYNRGQLKSK